MDHKLKKGMGFLLGIWVLVATFPAQSFYEGARPLESRTTLDFVQPRIATLPAAIAVRALGDEGASNRPPVGLNANEPVGPIAFTAPGTDSGRAALASKLQIPSPPVIGVIPSSIQIALELGQGPVNRTLAIRNIGGGTLQYQLTTDSPSWISINRTSGSSAGGVNLHAIRLDTMRLAPGHHEGGIIISGNAPSQTVEISVTVREPDTAIGVIPSSMEIVLDPGQGPVNRMIAVENTGGGTLYYQLEVSPSSWIHLDRTSGSTTGWAQLHNLVLDTERLSPGRYRGTITITGNAPSKTVEISVTIREPDPAIGVVPSSIQISLDEGQGPVNRMIAVENTGGGTLNYELIADPASWISLDRTYGSSSGRVQLHRLHLDTTQLPPGVHQGTITIAGNAPSTTVAITVMVHGIVRLPDLAVSDTDISPVAPTQLAPGDPLALGAFLENRGEGSAGGFWIEVWGSRTGGLTLDHILVPSLFLSGGLAAGETYSWVTSSPLSSVPDGYYTVVYVIDRANEVEESNEGNNRQAVSGKRVLVIRPPTNANIVVEGFGVSPNPAQKGQQVTFSGRVANRGTDPTGPFWIEFWGSYDRPYPVPQFLLADSIYVPNLEPGQEVDLSSEVRVLYDVPTGEFMVGCVADREDTVYETDETDNHQFIDRQAFSSP